MPDSYARACIIKAFCPRRSLLSGVDSNRGMDRQAVVVTGVSTGIGLATTNALISKGIHVFGSLRRQHDVEHMPAHWGQECFTPLLFDVTDAAAIAIAVEQVSCYLDSPSMSLHH